MTYAIYTSRGGCAVYRVKADEIEELFGAHLTTPVTYTCEKELNQENVSRFRLRESLHDCRTYTKMCQEDWAISALH